MNSYSANLSFVCKIKIIRGHIDKHYIIAIKSMKTYNENSFIEKLQNMDWSIVLNSIDDVNMAWESFKAMFTLAIDEIAPMKDIRKNIGPKFG